jgi:hypothetical protein
LVFGVHRRERNLSNASPRIGYNPAGGSAMGIHTGLVQINVTDLAKAREFYGDSKP